MVDRIIGTMKPFHSDAVVSGRSLGNVAPKKKTSAGSASMAQGNVVVVELHGLITKYECPHLDCETTALRTFLEILLEAVNDAEVPAVVIDIASPGGYVGACLDMVTEVVRISPKKILGFIGREACGSAFAIAAASHRVYAAPLARMGACRVRPVGMDSQGEAHLRELSDALTANMGLRLLQLRPTADRRAVVAILDGGILTTEGAETAKLIDGSVPNIEVIIDRIIRGDTA
jgi:membrane-bound ClpP family serine protease